MLRVLPWWFVGLLVLPLPAQDREHGEECTVGVACGRATADGRPLLWKNRDARQRDNVVMALADGRIPYFALCDAGKVDVVWGGANLAGFCILNAVSRDLPEGGKAGPGNGAFMKLALQSCENVEQFEALLKQTDATGRRTRANFGVVDAAGAAAFFEAGPTSFQRFDAAAEATGLLVRTNFAATGGGDRGRDRFTRAAALLALPAARPLTPRFLLQQMLRDVQAPPGAAAGGAGRLDTRETIHRQNTVAALVLHGVQKGEDPRWTTMWTILGQPLFGVAVPLLPVAGTVPAQLAGDPRSAVCDLSRRLAEAFYVDTDAAASDDEAAEGEVAGTLRWLRTDTMPVVRRAVLFAEAEILGHHEEVFAAWRKAGPVPQPAAARAFQEAMARRVLRTLTELADRHAPVPAGK